MFESATSFGDDDLELETSFAPIFSSTQDQLNEKRKSEVSADKNVKKIRTDFQPVHSLIRNSSLENATKENYFSPNKVVKRMFPGPAGLLPDDIGKKTVITSHSSNGDSEEFFFCSQRSVSTFTEGPWKMMTEDFLSSSEEQLYDKFTISWIKKKYCQKRVLDTYKAPFLAAIIQNVEIVDGKIPSVHITLKDTTGTIDGVILHRFYKDNSRYFTTGSVLVLKQFGVLNVNEGHCLTITSKNVVVIYHIRDSNNNDDADNVGKKEPFEKIVLQHYSADDILKEANINNIRVTKNRNDTVKNRYATPYGKNIRSVNSGNLSRPVNIPCQSNVITQNTIPSREQSGGTSFLLPKLNIISVNNQNISTIQEDLNTLEKNTTGYSNRKKFDFKKVNNLTNSVEHSENVVVSCSQMSVKADKKDSELWKSVLEDVDSESLFGDF